MENAPDEPKELLRRVPRDSSGRKTHYPSLRRRLVELEDLHEKLQRSEAYWAEAQRLCHTGSFGWSVPAGGMSWSDETFRIFEYDPGVVPTLDLMLDRVHSEERKNVEQIIDRASRDGTDCNFENRLRLPDGTIKYVRIVAHAVKKRAGGVEFVGAVTDITDRKQAEQVLRRRESYLEESQRLTQTGSFAWDHRTRKALYWSEEMFRIFGLDPRQGLPTFETYEQLIHPEDRDELRAIRDKAIREKTDYVGDFRILLRDGTVKHLHMIGHLVLDSAGEVTERIGTAVDVTAQKRAEQTLRESEAYLVEAQRLSQTGSWAWNPGTGDIRYWSKECYRVLGFDPTGSPPRFEDFFQRLHPDDQAESREQFEKAIRERTDFEFGYRIVHPDKGVRDIWVVGHAVLDRSGDLLEFVGTVIDITDRKRAEQELQQQIEREFNARIEGQIDERLRVARELHDTLLQSFSGLLLRLQAARNLFATRPTEALLKVLDGALDLGEQAIAEGRDAIKNMRSSTEITNDLADAMRAVGDEFASIDSSQFRVLIAGSPRDIHPIVRDEVYRIAREAIRNAFRHARANLIEVELTYNDSLRLRVRDDGKGIDPGIVNEGRSGHYGLPGMWERAAQIGGAFEIRSSPGAGTEIELNIPGSVAYERLSNPALMGIFRRKTNQAAAHHESDE